MQKIYHDNMTSLEVEIANKVGEYKKEIQNMSIIEFAGICNVSIAMITKYSIRCGFSGYKELKYYVKMCMMPKNNINNDIVIKKINNYFQYYDHIKMCKLNELCRNTQKIILYGKGASFGVCNYFRPRLSTAYCKNTVAENDQQQLDSEFSFVGNKLFIIISSAGNLSEFEKHLKKANNLNIKTVIISESNVSFLSSKCDLYINLSSDMQQVESACIKGRTLFFIYLETLIQLSLNDELII